MLGDVTDKLNTSSIVGSPNVTITPNIRMDEKGILGSVYEYGKSVFESKLGGSNAMFGDLFSGGSFNLTSQMSQETAAMEQQRHADTEANTTRVKELTDAMTKLTENWKGGVINIPENATFTVPVNVDGETIANVTAPYLDVINAKNTDLDSKGVAY
jgi:hypothetical protein